MRVVAVVAPTVIETTQTLDEVGRNVSFPACGRRPNRPDEWHPLYRLTAVSCVIGGALEVIVDRSFITEHPLAVAWPSRQLGSW
jgi:hypothetical protein